MSNPNPFDRLETAAETVAQRAMWETMNRVALLWCHAVIAFVTGTQMLAFGSAANIEALVGIWSRTALGVLGILGGITLAVGIWSGRRIWLEALGLVLIGCWDFLMAAGFVAARIQAGDFHLRGLAEPLPAPGTYSLPYPITVYAGLFALVCIHLLTLRRLAVIRRGGCDARV